MKIVSSVSRIYEEQYEANKRLKKRIDELISSIKPPSWHYISRLKKKESFAQKLETGRVNNPSQMEDFFACTLVVENNAAISKAKNELKKHFKIIEARPENPKQTHKESSSFVFDDLRLYVTLKPTSAREKGPINDLIFEVQIKTFLQHAWSIATHDLVYKSDQLSWTKERVAYQVKAMLENAEISIDRAGKVKQISGLPESNYKIDFQNEIRSFVFNNWSKDFLPDDLMRLIRNIENLLKFFHLSIVDLQGYLDSEKSHGRGVLTLNLSPYLIILQSVINQNPKKFNAFLKKNFNGNYRPKIIITDELDLSKIQNNIDSEQVIRIA